LFAFIEIAVVAKSIDSEISYRRNNNKRERELSHGEGNGDIQS